MEAGARAGAAMTAIAGHRRSATHAGTGLRGWPAAAAVGGQLDRIDFVDRESIEDLTIRKGKPFLLLHCMASLLGWFVKGYGTQNQNIQPNPISRRDLHVCSNE